MDAGQELDVLIAKRVMGWQWVTNPHGQEGWASNGSNEGLVAADGTWGGFWVYPLTPPYSTDIAAAWAVVEALKGRGVWVHSLEGKWEQSWRCIFERKGASGHGSVFAQEMGDTAPHAICLAALVALAD